MRVFRYKRYVLVYHSFTSKRKKKKEKKFLNLVRGFDLCLRGPIVNPDRLQHSFVKWMGSIFSFFCPSGAARGKREKQKKPWNQVNLNMLHYDPMLFLVLRTVTTLPISQLRFTRFLCHIPPTNGNDPSTSPPTSGDASPTGMQDPVPR